MADETPAAEEETPVTFELDAWEDLPIGVKRNRRKMYEYIRSVLAGDD